jgi:hypothetical protein
MKRFENLLLVLCLCFGLGCSTFPNVEACYFHPEYGQVCVKYDGKLSVRFDIANDPAKLAEVKSWLEAQGVKVE